ncbi:MAG: substrate-binding domain-containing protein [Acidimicrobiales bacterium]|jgi:rhamnose transport system substrate-binding protein
MKRKVMKSALVVVAVIGAGVLPAGLLAATGSASAAGMTKVFMIPKFTGIAPFTDAANGCKTEGAKVGLDCLYGGPTTGSATDQVNFINNAVSAGDKGIFISNDDAATTTPALVRAEHAGVKVVTFDSDALPAGRTVFVEGTSTTSIAETELNMLGSQTRPQYTGSFIILSAQATDTNQVTWNAQLKKDLSLPKYKNMKLAALINPPSDSAADATTSLQSALASYPKINGIIAPTTVAVAAAAQYLTTNKLCKKYVLTGLGDPDQMEPFMTKSNNCVHSFALWNFTQEGTVAACAMADVLAGTLTGKTGQTFECAGTKEVVLADQTVSAGNAVVYTMANVKSAGF